MDILHITMSQLTTDQLTYDKDLHTNGILIEINNFLLLHIHRKSSLQHFSPRMSLQTIILLISLISGGLLFQISAVHCLS